MARFHVTVDAKTGVKTTTPYTAQEELDQDALEAAVGAAQLRLSDLSGDAMTTTVIDLLKTKTAQQIKDYMTANVTSLAQAKTVLTSLTLAMAYVLRNQV